jgi:hypothetical protein
MTKQEIINAISAKQEQVVNTVKEIKALRTQLKQIEALEAQERAEKAAALKLQNEIEVQKVSEQKSVEEMLAAQLEQERVKAFQRQLLLQEHEEECKKKSAAFEETRIANPVLNYSKKERAGKTTEIYTWESHTDCEHKVIIKWDKIEIWSYGSKACYYTRVGNNWVRSYGNKTVAHSKNIAAEFVPQELLATLPTKTAKKK